MSFNGFDKEVDVTLTVFGGLLLFLWSIGEILSSASIDVVILAFAVSIVAVISGGLFYSYPEMHQRLGLTALLSGLFFMIYIGMDNLNSTFSAILEESAVAQNMFHAVFPLGLFLVSVGGIFIVTYHARYYAEGEVEGTDEKNEPAAGSEGTGNANPDEEAKMQEKNEEEQTEPEEEER